MTGKTETCWTASVLTLFPLMFPGPLAHSLSGRALTEKLWALEALNIRDFAQGKHASVDDTPAGGGPGMVMRADVSAAALDSVCQADDGRPAIYLSPRGKSLTQARIKELAAGPGIVLFCGRFEGVDERFIEARNLEEISIGDFVLSGGEIAGLALIDAVVRMLPGVIGTQASLVEESFSGGLLEYPQYTRPRIWEGREIPDVLLSGDHGAVHAWRQEKSETLTQTRRPDMWSQYVRAQN